MSKPTISFGLKKSGPAKPASARPKPAPFGGVGGGDDGSGDEAAPNNVVEVSELDNFGSTSPKAPSDSPEGRKKPNKKSLKSGDELPPPQSKQKPPPIIDQFGDLSSALTSRKHAASAEEADPSIYDYDAAYDSIKAAKAAAAAANKDGDGDKRRPRYFDALRQAAEVRERDRQIAEERRLQRERAAEGDAFADKEKFVTEAYRRQQEANRRLMEEEKRREEEEERRRNEGRGMAEFYKSMLERGEQEHAALVKAAEEKRKAGAGKEGEGGGEGGEEDEEVDREKSAAERAREINAMGGNVLINDEGEVVDKRQLLKGGLNVAPKKRAEVEREKARQRQEEAAAAAARARNDAQSRGVYAAGGRQAMRERQTRMLEAQLEETLKRSRQEEEEEAARIQLASKSRKTAADISSARERYLARKRAAEEAKKNGLAEGP